MRLPMGHPGALCAGFAWILAAACVDSETSLPLKFVLQVGSPNKLAIHLQCADDLQLTYRSGASYNADDTLSLSGQFWMMDLTGRNAVMLTADTASHEGPSWSPDGTRLAFESNRSGHHGIWVRQANGDAVSLTTGLQEDFGPRWSPDGTRLLFSSRSEGGVVSSKPDGTDRRTISSGSTMESGS